MIVVILVSSVVGIGSDNIVYSYFDEGEIEFIIVFSVVLSLEVEELLFMIDIVLCMEVIIVIVVSMIDSLDFWV